MDVVNPMVRRMQQEARDDPDGFWAKEAERLPWFKKWDTVFDWTPPTFRWFSGAETNLAWNCLDRHVAAGRSGHGALIGVNELGERRTYTYGQLLREVERVAAALRGMGVGKGDRVTVYMPTMPEAIILMLAVVRIGAIHSVVFAGFGAGALGERIRLSGSKAVFAADVTWRKGKTVDLKGIVDNALSGGGHAVEKVVVLQRQPDGCPMEAGRDITWDEFLTGGAGHDTTHVPMEANEPAFILATSGTTAAPKLAVHVHGGYQVGIHSTGQWVMDLRPDDVWWSTSDIGWIVGHSYIVYAPLLAGATTIAFEGSIDHPGPEAFYKIIEDNIVTGIFTSPTAVRLMMRYGEEAAKGVDLTSLTRVLCAGETLNPPAWEWLQKKLLEDRIPVIDHMWQTETGGPVFGNPYGVALLPIKPGSAGIPMPGWDVEIVDDDGKPVGPGVKGIVVIKRPFPSMLPTIWGDPDRYERDYWGKLPGVYYTGDAAEYDEDGYFWFSGRADEIIKIAGHRIGTVEVETAFLRHPAVAEAGCTGRPDELRGEVISAFVVLKAGNEPSEELEAELLATVRKELGPVAVIADCNFVSMLPKTRSGKIMRRVFKAVVLGKDIGDVSTIEDEGSVEDAREAWALMVKEMGGDAPT
ncbi:MAG: acetyl-CoA synthetase [Actinomycetota bacterium]|nr:acetyl-CoA synthetase [Actinomycetota bacterium]MDQ1506858.1 acetyl-CoA synthetase [Actinomycetota bacterium]